MGKKDKVKDGPDPDSKPDPTSMGPGPFDPAAFVPHVMVRDAGAPVMRLLAQGVREADNTLVVVLGDEDGRVFTVEVPVARVTVTEPGDL